MMTIDQIVDSLEKISEGTDFSFDISENKNEEIELLVNGDNPESEDWNFYITIETPETEKDLAKSLRNEFFDLYDNYDVGGEEEYIKYSCQLCESIAKSYPNKLMDKDEQFIQFSLPKGIDRCPCCGVYINWNYKEIR